MKKSVLILLPILYLWFGVFPSFPINGEVNSIRIEKIQSDQSSRCIDISDVVEINKLLDPIDFFWTSLWPVNSWEESPRYWIILTYIDGSADRYFFSENEWHHGAKTPKNFIDIVKQYTITNKCIRPLTRVTYGVASNRLMT